MKFQFISNYRSKFGVEKMCQVLHMSRSGYYTWRSRCPSPRAQQSERLLAGIRKAYQAGRRVYGSPRITAELKEQGLQCSKNRVARLMRANGIRAQGRRKFKTTTNSNHQLRVAPNLVNQSFAAAAANQLWTSDITYVWTPEGWLYLAVILDCYSRQVVGWSMANSLCLELVIDAFQQAVGRRRLPTGIVFHSDRGSQYASDDFKELLKQFDIQQSMSRKGNCYDNAITESFFSTLKTELIYQHRFQTKQQAQMAIFEYIEVFYNRIRRHSAINYLSPYEFEKQTNGS